MVNSKVIRVPIHIHKQLMDMATRTGVTVQDCLEYLLNSSQERADLLKVFFEDYANSSAMSEEELEGYLEEGVLASMLSSYEDDSAQFQEILQMFPCSICGEPMHWSTDDAIGKALKDYMQNSSFLHSRCKKEEE